MNPWLRMFFSTTFLLLGLVKMHTDFLNWPLWFALTVTSAVSAGVALGILFPVLT